VEVWRRSGGGGFGKSAGWRRIAGGVLEQRLGEAWRSRGAGGLLVRGGSLESHN
jgi:hypothetical protein